MSENDQLVIKPVEDIIDLAGTFKPKQKRSILKAREAIEKTYKPSPSTQNY